MAGTRKTTGSGKGRSGGAGAGKGAKAAPAVKLVEPAAPDMTLVSPAAPVVADRVVKKAELIEQVVEATGMKRKDVKPVVEATLREISRVIAGGANMQIPELGKLMIHKRKELPGGEMVMLKLRRKTAAKPLAEDDDNG